jgi:hypothetical protein
VSDATAGITVKFLHPYEGPYVIAKVVPPSTFQVVDESERVRGQFNKRLLKAYTETSKTSERGAESELKVQSGSRKTVNSLWE